MTNPFTKTVDESIFLFIPSISDKQAEYAARAINQHEKLVAMLRDLEWSNINGLSGTDDCPYCGQTANNGHAKACEIAALLTEETDT